MLVRTRLGKCDEKSTSSSMISSEWTNKFRSYDVRVMRVIVSTQREGVSMGLE